MRAWRWRWCGQWLVLLVWALAGLGTLRAEPVSETDSRDIRAVIQAQLDALAADDVECRAFAYASPAIRVRFGDADTFMAMVRDGYPMLVRPAATAFYQPEEVDGAVVQSVGVRDRAGRSWRATYQLQRQADRSWRIDGCVVAPDSGRSST